MAAATFDMNQKVISIHLDLLEEQRGHLHTAVDEYVDKVMDTGKKWTLSTERNYHTFSSVLCTMNKAVAFLSLKCEEMKYDSVAPAVSATLKGVDENDDISLQNCNLPKERYVNKNLSDLTPERGSSSVQQKQELDETAQQEKGKNIKKAEKQSQQESELCDLKKQLQHLSVQQDCLDKKLNKKLVVVRDEIDSLKSDVQGLSSASETLQVLFENQKEIGDKTMRKISNKMESLEFIISDLSEKGDESNETLQVLSENQNEFEDKTVRDFSDKIESLQLMISDLSENQEEIAVNVKEVDGRLREMELKGLNDIDHWLSQIESHVIPNNMNEVEKQFEEVQTNYKIMCQLLVNRLQPLEQLRDVLNERTRARDENIKQLHELVNQSLTMSDRVTQLEVHPAVKTVGFYAATNFSNRDKKLTECTVCPFYHPFGCLLSGQRFNSGQFNDSTGIFRVAVDGTYLVNISTYSPDCVKFKMYAVHLNLSLKWNRRAVEHYICFTDNEVKSSMCLIQMMEGDELYAKITSDSQTPKQISLLCFRIG